jgi:predicted Zn-dependent protease
MSALSPQDLVERALAASRSDGCVVLVTSERRTDLRWARTTLTTNGDVTSTAATVIAFRGTATGTASGSLTRNAAAADAGDAEDAAPLLGGAAHSPDWSDPADAGPPAVFAGLAAGLGEVFASAQAAGIEHFGYAEHGVETTWLGSSTGLRLRFTQPAGRLELTAKSHARTRSTWAGLATTDGFEDVDLAAVDAELRRALSWQGRRVDVPPGRHDAVLSPSASADLLVELWWSAVGRDAVEGHSVFSRSPGHTRLGETLSVRPLTVRSDPHHPGLRCAPFQSVAVSSPHASVFDNGLPIGRVDWVADGRLAALVTTRASARDLGLPVAASAENLVVADREGRGTLDDLVARTDRGLLVTCLWYNRLVDPQTLLLTGLTRDGVYLVEGGEVVGTVGNYRFNDSPVGMLARITDSGDTVRTLGREMADYVNRVAAPPLRVADFHFSTVSDAL